jgi:hypothetical protein
VDQVAARTGQQPANWLAVVRAGALPGIPTDPTGTPFEIAAGRVRLSAKSSLYPLPDEPKHLGVPPS